MVTGIWRYQLTPVGGQLPPREGALIRHELAVGIGYADLHPWPELGDLSLEEQLFQMREGGCTNLLVQNRFAALADALPRYHLKKPFSPLAHVPPSHASLPYLLRTDSEVNRFSDTLGALEPLGFDRLKLKLSGKNQAEMARLTEVLPQALRHGYRIRLDLNARPTALQVLALLHRLVDVAGEDLAWLDWIEDPCLWSFNAWKAIKEQFNVRLALDFAASPAEALTNAAGPADLAKAVDVLVVKPAAQESFEVARVARQAGLQLAVTSYLDHPVGQFHAARIAATMQFIASNGAAGFGIEPGGLCSHLVYEPNEFSERLAIKDGKLIPPAGTGLGFDDLLEKLPWTDL